MVNGDFQEFVRLQRMTDSQKEKFDKTIKSTD